MLNYKAIIVFTGLLALAINNFAVAALNDTSITTCSNATQNGLPCPVAGYTGQDAEYDANFYV